MPHEIGKLADELLRDPAKVAVSPAASTVDSVTQKYLAVVNGFWQDHVIATSDMQPILEALDVISPAVQHV